MHRDALWIYVLTAVALIIGCIALLWFLYTQSRYTFTSRRCIYFVRNSLFHRHYNEIHLVDLRTAVPKKIGLFGLMFGYGTLILTDKDDKRIIYAGISEHKYLSRYLGRIVDYIKIHGHTDNLSAYQPRKIRETEKSL